MLKNITGLTLVELIVASGIIGIVAAALLSASSMLTHQRSQFKEAAGKSRIIENLIENIQNEANQFQLNFEPKDTGSFDALEIDDLPLAFNANIFVPKDECLDCPGRMGYSIRPVSGNRGLYLATAYVVHRDLNNGKMFRYQFVVSGK
ncbi:type II secretion system protein [Candidatus Nomurabacteria bacterium]|nr:type II secretion system protein [Candidatus Nomurabacteria bacterium]